LAWDPSGFALRMTKWRCYSERSPAYGGQAGLPAVGGVNAQNDSYTHHPERSEG